jgi:hypothetical protein
MEVAATANDDAVGGRPLIVKRSEVVPPGGRMVALGRLASPGLMFYLDWSR